MTDRARRLSSEAASYSQSPATSIRQSSSPAPPQAGSGTGTSHWPDRRRLSSNSVSQPQSPGINRLPSDQASVSSQHQRQPHQLQQEQQQRMSLEVPPDDAGQMEPNPPKLAPVFALVDDGTTRTTHHPRIRYIFSDDDPDILTSALTEAASHHPPLGSPSFALPVPADPRTGRPPDRAILLDLVPNADGTGPGFSVAAASSLSADFAVTSVSLSRDPPDDGPHGGANVVPGEDDAGGEHLTLRIEGVSAEGPPSFPALTAGLAKRTSPSASGGGLTHSIASSGSGRSRGAASGGREEISMLAEDFDRRMGVLRRVVEAFEAGANVRRDSDSDPAGAALAAGEDAEEASSSEQRRNS